jgi:hypothetical protein
MYELLSSKKPSVLLYAGSSKADCTFSIVKLGHNTPSTTQSGISDPEVILEEGDHKSERMIWERLQRMKKRNYRWYEIEFARVVVYMEENGGSMAEVLERYGIRLRKEEDRQLIAIWNGSTRMNLKRGSFFIRRKETTEESEWKRFETLVPLTGLAIIEVDSRLLQG